MSETAIMQRIRLDLGREPGVLLFRNNTGVLRDDRGRPVRFGLHPGSGDLIGVRSITITPEMVGQTVGLIASIEVKTETGKPRPDQIRWAETICAAGGLAGIARNTADARVILGLPL